MFFLEPTFWLSLFSVTLIQIALGADNLIIITIIANKLDKSEWLDKKPKPGATATAAIHCGRSSVGYSWFHEGIDWFRKQMFVYLY